MFTFRFSSSFNIRQWANTHKLVPLWIKTAGEKAGESTSAKVITPDRDKEVRGNLSYLKVFAFVVKSTSKLAKDAERHLLQLYSFSPLLTGKSVALRVIHCRRGIHPIAIHCRRGFHPIADIQRWDQSDLEGIVKHRAKETDRGCSQSYFKQAACLPRLQTRSLSYTKLRGPVI